MADQVKGDTTVDTAKIAEFCGVTTRYCNQLADQGHMNRAAKGRFFLLSSLRGYLQLLQAKARTRGHGPGEEAEDLVRERVRLTHHNANIAALDERQKAGELVNVHDVAEVWSGRMIACRSRLLSLPNKLASAAMAADSLQDAADVATRLIHEALHELAAEDEKEISRIRRAAARDASAGKRQAAAADADAERVGGTSPGAEPGGQRGAGKVAQRARAASNGRDG